MRSYWVADLKANGELQSEAPYDYAHLERLPGCAELIGHLSGALWASCETFEIDLATTPTRLWLRWQATAPSAGLMTLRWQNRVVSITVLASGIDRDLDDSTIGVLQRKLVQELHDTGHEAAFSLTDLHRRPLAATINIATPDEPTLHLITAVADRCFAAAYFRYLGLV